jgi:uncharacterized protein YlxW (UPF0749 family)
VTKIRALSLTVAVIALAIVLGIAVGHQFTIKKNIDKALDPNTTEAMATEVAQLIKENKDLRRKRDQLTSERDKLKSQYGDRSSALETVDSNMAKYIIVAGTSAVTGHGVVATINHELAVTQLIDLVNAIRNSGAEAMAINGRRIIVSSAFTQSDISKNYRVEIIGNPLILSDALQRKGGILDQITNGQVEEKNDIYVPAVK